MFDREKFEINWKVKIFLQFKILFRGQVWFNVIIYFFLFYFLMENNVSSLCYMLCTFISSSFRIKILLQRNSNK